MEGKKTKTVKLKSFLRAWRRMRMTRIKDSLKARCRREREMRNMYL